VSPGLMRTGSHLNAHFKGRHGREFAWFALAAALPITSNNAERAAGRIVNAARRRQSNLTITFQAKLIAALSVLAPGAIATAMALANRLLPRSGGKHALDDKTGWQSRPRWLPSIVTKLADRAAIRNNEVPKGATVH